MPPSLAPPPSPDPVNPKNETVASNPRMTCHAAPLGQGLLRPSADVHPSDPSLGGPPDFRGTGAGEPEAALCKLGSKASVSITQCYKVARRPSRSSWPMSVSILA